MSGGWTIRRMRQSEYALLPGLLLKAIYLPEGTPPPPFEAVFSPELLPYTVGFGAGAYDRALCAVVRGTVIGAVWVRLVRGFGYLDDATPELALVVEEPFRGRGIGTELLRRMLLLAADEGVQHLSLSVQRANPARRLYLRMGFETVRSHGGEDIMCRPTAGVERRTGDRLRRWLEPIARLFRRDEEPEG